MTAYILKAIPLLTLLQLTILTHVWAQVDSSSYAPSNLEIFKNNRDFSYISPKGELGGPTKFVLTGRVTSSYFLLANPKIPVYFALVQDFTVKVLDQKSAAVRTPSLKLGGVWYVPIRSNASHYRYASLKFMHHSNGQDGQSLNQDLSINTRDGNFSTNYLVLSYHFGGNVEKGKKGYTLNHDAGLQWHKWFDYERALSDDYGFTRIIYNVSFRKQLENRESWRLNAGLNYAVNNMADYKTASLKKRLNTEVSFHYSLPFMHKAYLMAAAGYYGEDPYNIYYRDKYRYLRFGVSTNL
ncbi:MAG: hypothetical protein EOO20_18155 [Chryseobacterium sp.]|nr:MAG: hypothetical protein EOO20_18155 [Chryseobacterium sp.]